MRIIDRLKAWEYWPFQWVYGPIYVFFFGYMLRSGLRCFFAAANPRIYSGGFLMESKIQVYATMSAALYPALIAAMPGDNAADLLQRATQAGIDFPMVLKPDIGGRGRAVVIAESADELAHYIPFFTLPFMVQAYMPYPHEVGIFFVKMPGEKKGRVTGVVGKDFGKVTGNGKDTLDRLIQKDSRLMRYYDSLQSQWAARLHTIPAEGEVVLLIPYGNHARGTAFYNWQHLIDERLHAWANQVADGIDEFYYGRMDVRYADWDDMLAFKNFSIIEVNGSGSEPTHMYDPSWSIWHAWAEVIRHWHMLWQVSHANHKRGIAYMGLAEGKAMYRASQQYDAQLEVVHTQILKNRYSTH